jgi:hypothetical protein
MTARKAQERSIGPILSPERAHPGLKLQLESLEQLKGRRFDEAEYDEREWVQVTRSIFEDAFGNSSSTLSSFISAKSAGDYYMIPYGGAPDYGLDQRNFETRIQSMESCLKAALKQLELRLPKSEVKGAYAPGEEYEVYKDIQTVLSRAKATIFIIDPYLDRGIFELYVDGIDRSIQIRVLTNNLPADALTVASKYAAGGNLQLRTTKAIHDRAIFADDRLWLVGQSLKDAAKQKPTYLIEHDGTLMSPLYEDIWNKAQIQL